jgi:hypothetical protein
MALDEALALESVLGALAVSCKEARDLPTGFPLRVKKS